MTSSKKLRKAANSFEGKQHRQILLSLPFPRFVWIVEYSTPSHFDERKADYRFIVDATAQASSRDQVLLRQLPGLVYAKIVGVNGTLEKQFSIEKKPTTFITGNLKDVIYRSP